MDITTKERNKVAICKINKGVRKACDRCKYKFFCFSNKFKPSDVVVPKWLVTIPNDEEGREFLRVFDKYLNKDYYRLKKRGRAKNRVEKSGNSVSISWKKGDKIAVYINYTAIGRRFKFGDDTEY